MSKAGMLFAALLHLVKCEPY